MMGIIGKYIFREALRYFGFVLTMVVIIFLAVDFIENMDEFLKDGVVSSRIVLYLACKTPWVIAKIAPVGILLAVLILLGLMSRQNEILALKSCGVKVMTMLAPVVFLGVLASGTLFLFSEIVVPRSIAKANWILQSADDRLQITGRNDIWFRQGRNITHIRMYDPSGMTMLGISRFELDGDFQLLGRMDARSGYYAGGRWLLEDVVEQKRNHDGAFFEIVHRERKEDPMGFEPADFNKIARKPDEMSALDIYRQIREIEGEGYSAIRLRVSLLDKFGFPFICLIMAIIGGGIAFRIHRHFGPAAGVAIGLVVITVYWFCYSFSLSMGNGGMLPPLIAAWAPNAMFLAFGGSILFKVD